MVKEILEYECEKCGEIFPERAIAEDHEQVPLKEIPEGFIYFRNSPPRYEENNGWIRGNDRTAEMGLNALHDVEYTIHNLGNFHIPSRASVTLNAFILNASNIRRNVTEFENRYRHATDEDVRLVLSYERIVDKLLSQGLTELTLDLEGEQTVPIVYSGEPARI